MRWFLITKIYNAKAIRNFAVSLVDAAPIFPLGGEYGFPDQAIDLGFTELDKLARKLILLVYQLKIRLDLWSCPRLPWIKGFNSLPFIFLIIRKPQSFRLRVNMREFFSEANKGVRWMPWLQEAKKDVASCDKPGRDANSLWLRDFRMGEPSGGYTPLSCTEYIGVGSERRELKHLSTYRKRNQTRFP